MMRAKCKRRRDREVGRPWGGGGGEGGATSYKRQCFVPGMIHSYLWQTRKNALTK